MSQEGWFQGRPPLERLRVISITCLVLDSLFVFIYGMMALSESSPSEKTQCYEEYRYIWHDIIAGTLMLSAFVAVGGAVTHGTVACAAHNTEQQLVGISRFSHSLVFWTFVQAVLEAIAYGQEPPQCAALGHPTHAGAQPQPQQHGQAGEVDAMHPAERTLVVYQVVSTMLWLCWVTGCVAAGVLSRRCIAYLPEAGERSPDAESGLSCTPQTVGMPVSQLPCGMIAIDGAAQASSAEPESSSFGAPTFAGQPVVGAGGGMVAQGRPVAGSESTKGGGSSSGLGKSC